MLSTPSSPPCPSTRSPLLTVTFPSALLSFLLSARVGLSTITRAGPNSVRPFFDPCHRYCPNPFYHRIDVLHSSTIPLLRGILRPRLLPSDRRPPLLLRRPTPYFDRSKPSNREASGPPSPPRPPLPLLLPRPRTSLRLHLSALIASKPRHSAGAFCCFPLVYAIKIVASGGVHVFRELSKIATQPDYSSLVGSPSPPPLCPSPPPDPLPPPLSPHETKGSPLFRHRRKKRKEE